MSKVFGSFGVEDLQGAASAKPKVSTVDMVLRHPNHSKIAALCATLASGTEDVAGVANEIKGLLESDGVCIRIAATRKEDDGSGTMRDVPVIVNGQRTPNFGNFSIWARKPRAEDTADEDAAANKGVMIYKSWARQGQPRFVRKFYDAACATLRAMLGVSKPATEGGDQIPEGHGAPVTQNAGDRPVDLD